MRYLYIALIGALLSCIHTSPASADVQIKSKKIELEYWGGVQGDDGNVSLSRVTVRPSVKASFAKKWRGELDVRFEFADDDTGLGTASTYSDLARPLLRSETTRLEIDRAILAYRSGGARVSLGKQVMAWGVLDGIQVTDRFDPVRRRDFVLTETRPERIARWGMRWQQKWDEWNFDVGLSLDPTVNQLANQGDAFSPVSPRYRAGLTATASAISARVDDRNDYLGDATYGLKVSREIGQGTFSALWLSGPETDPVFELNLAQPATVDLTYPRRSVIGAAYDRAAGPFVLRLEGAHIPEQPLNLRPTAPAIPIATGKADRWIAGIGADWNAPADIFVNAQVSIDHVEENEAILLRPRTDTIYSLSFRRGFYYDRLMLKSEFLGSPEAGDGVATLGLAYELHDSAELSIGGNLIFGDSLGTFGQFNEQSRIWTRLRVSL